MSHHTLRRIRAFTTLALLATAILGGVAASSLGRLPDPNTLTLSPKSEPIQSPTDDPIFHFEYGGETYEIEPLATYSIAGLVVSHNNIHAFDDIYHTDRSVDIKDICVVWGENLGGVYREVEFWSEPFSCWMKTESADVLRRFNQSQLSNSHLLAADPKVRDTIRAMKIGDEIRMQGVLVSYAPKSAPNLRRVSSLTRNDRGNGACEVLFVDDAEILTPFNHRAYERVALAKRLLLIGGVVWILLFVAEAYAQAYRK